MRKTDASGNPLPPKPRRRVRAVSPLPMRDGVSASWVSLPAGGWANFGHFFAERFPLVTREDSRLVSDIEKLIKKKIELEPIELDEGRPWRDERPRRAREEVSAAPETSRPVRSHAPPKAPQDPFFDKPYEPSGSGEPMWEKKAPTISTGRALSPNIKPKKKVAALFGGGKPAG